jgi:hypothetical protein
VDRERQHEGGDAEHDRVFEWGFGGELASEDLDADVMSEQE